MSIRSLFHPRTVIEEALVDELAHVSGQLERLRRCQAELLDRLVAQGLGEADAVSILAGSQSYRALRRDENLYMSMWLRLTRRLEKLPQAEAGEAGGDDDAPAPGEPLRMPAREAAPRNAPCPCGSGLKYKRCCLGKALPQAA